jgi:anti-sigma B factor antagonist
VQGIRIDRTDDALALEGEIDLAVADQLDGAVRQALDDGITVLDLSQVTFLDSTGLRIILSASRALNSSGPLVLRRPSNVVRRVLDVAIPGGAPGLVIDDDGRA